MSEVSAPSFEQLDRLGLEALRDVLEHEQGVTLQDPVVRLRRVYLEMSKSSRERFGSLAVDIGVFEDTVAELCERGNADSGSKT